MNCLNKTKKITLSGITIALYVVTMYFTQGFAFGQYQVRLSTSLYSLGYIFPFLVIPMGIANFISNTLMGGLGLFDMFGGAIVGIITTGLSALIKIYKLPKVLLIFPVLLIPSLMVPIWLSILLNLPYGILLSSLLIGQAISSVVGYILVIILEKRIHI